jgi:transketolase
MSSDMRFDRRRAVIDGILQHKKDHPGPLTLLAVDSKISSFTECFEAAHPGDFIDLGVMEQNAAAFAAGLASCGEKVVIIGIGTFVSLRPFEQIRTVIASGNYPVKIIALWSGLYYSWQGYSHTNIEDIAIMRTLPNVSIYSPSSYEETTCLTRQALEDDGFSYLRIDNPFVSVPSTGSMMPADAEPIVRMGQGRALALISTGVCLGECLKAAEMLEAEGIDCRVINIRRIKPLDQQSLLNHVDGVRAIITVEEHRTSGGLGSLVLETLARTNRHRVPIKLLGVNDIIPNNYNYEEAKAFCGLTTANILEDSRKLLSILR